MPFTFFKSVSTKINGKATQPLKGEPYTVSFKDKVPITVVIEFYKYLGEPNLEILFDKIRQGTFEIHYNPMVGEWTKREWIEL